MRMRAALAALFVSALALSGIGVPALAATSADPDHAAQGRARKEGSPARRAEYFRARHRSVDPRVNPAKARLSAVAEHTRNVASAGKVAPLALGTVWSAIGPTPITQGQTTPRANVTGRVTAIAFLGATPFVGGALGGLWTSATGGATWTEVGPIGGFASPAISSIAIHQGSGTMYVGTGEANYSNDSYYGVGVYKDAGGTWTGPLNTEAGTGMDIFTGASISDIQVDRTDANTVIACTSLASAGIGSVTYPNPPGAPRTGIYRSTDGGTTWTNALSGSFLCSNLVQDPKNATHWFAAMSQDSLTGAPQGANTLNGGLLYSSNGGANWVQLAGLLTSGNLTPPSGWIVTNPLPPNSGTTNQGWLRAVVTAGAASGDAESTIYVGNGMANVADNGNPPQPPVAAAGTTPGRVYKSTDSGKNWTFLTNTAGYCGTQCEYDLPVYAVPTQPQSVFTGGAGTSSTTSSPPAIAMLRASSNGGSTWADMTGGLHADQHAMAAEVGSTTNVWVGNDGGIWKTTGGPGGTWTNLNNPGLSLTQFMKISLHPTNASVVYGGTQDNGTESWSGSDAWFHTDDGDGGFAAISVPDPNKVAHTYYNTTNEQIGATFGTNGASTAPSAYPGGVFGYCKGCGPGGVNRTNGIPATDTVLFYAPMVMDPGTGAAGNTLYFGTQRLYRSSDFFNKAANAILVPTFTVFTDISGKDLASTKGSLSAIAPVANTVSPGSDAQVIFAGSSLGDMWRTTDGGANWWPLASSTSLYVADIAVDATTISAGPNNITLYLAQSGFESTASKLVKISVDGGQSWTDHGMGLPNAPVNALLVDPVNHNRVWAGTDLGVYLWNGASATQWIPYTTGMPLDVAVFDLKASASGDQIIAATHGRGAYRLGPLTPIVLQRFTAD